VYIESNGADELVNELEKSLSKDFRIGGRKSAQLVLECNGQMASETTGVGQARNSVVRHKVRIEVQFSLLSTENNAPCFGTAQPYLEQPFLPHKKPP